jgi:hypothetical protein
LNTYAHEPLMHRFFVGPYVACTVTLLALCLTACSERPSRSATEDAVETWTLTEDLRIGGDDEGPASFSRVHSVVEAPNGNVFVLELQDQELRVFDSQGNFLRVAAQRGAGPGELEYATGMALGPNVIVVNDPRQGRFTLVDFDGRFVRHVTATSSGYGDVWRGAVDSLGRIIDYPVRTPIGGVDARTGYGLTETRLRIIHADGHADTLAGVTCGIPAPSHVYRTPQGYATSFTLPFTASPQTVVTARGTVWCAPMVSYELLHAQLGQPLRTLVSREVTPIAVPRALRDSTEESLRQFASSMGTLVDDGGFRTPTTYPAIQHIDADSDGRVWVRRTSDAALVPIDVFDANGAQIASVQASRKLGGRLFIARQHLYAIELDEDDVPIVVRYRIVQ